MVNQPKKGFVIPMDQWLRKEIKSEVLEKIVDMPFHLSSMFHKNKIHKLMQAHMSEKFDHGWFIWALYSLVIWDSTHRNKFS